MKNIYKVWVFDCDQNMENDTAESYIMVAKDIVEVAKNIEEMYKDPDVEGPRHFDIRIETMWDGEETPRGVIETWGDELNGEEIADLMMTAPRFALDAIREKRARKMLEAEAEAEINSRV